MTILAGRGLVDLVLMASGDGADAAVASMDEDFSAAAGDDLFGRDHDTLAAVVLGLLRARGWRLATAESCTGGLVGALLTSVPGVQRCLRGWRDRVLERPEAEPPGRERRAPRGPWRRQRGGRRGDGRRRPQPRRGVCGRRHRRRGTGRRQRGESRSERSTSRCVTPAVTALVRAAVPGRPRLRARAHRQRRARPAPASAPGGADALVFAIPLPAEVHDAVPRGSGELRRRLAPARWVRPEGIHITMRFLGEQSAELLSRLATRWKPRLRAASPVEVALKGGGFFPHERRPRVAWLGGSAPGLELWAEAIERCATALGIEPEPRPFSLHVTLARLDRPWGEGDVETFLTAVGKWRLAPFVGREVVLFRSDLLPSGASYTPLHRFQVGA